MEYLNEGVSYNLSSLNKDESSTKTLIFLKLTDPALQSLEECAETRENTNAKPSIYFKNETGAMSLPVNGSYEVFQFSLSNIYTDGHQSSFECVEQHDDSSLKTVGCMQIKMQICAKEASFEAAKCKMEAVDRVRKRACTKEMKNPGFGRDKLNNSVSSTPFMKSGNTSLSAKLESRSFIRSLRSGLKSSTGGVWTTQKDTLQKPNSADLKKPNMPLANPVTSETHSTNRKTTFSKKTVTAEVHEECMIRLRSNRRMRAEPKTILLPSPVSNSRKATSSQEIESYIEPLKKRRRISHFNKASSAVDSAENKAFEIPNSAFVPPSNHTNTQPASKKRKRKRQKKSKNRKKSMNQANGNTRSDSMYAHVPPPAQYSSTKNVNRQTVVSKTAFVKEPKSVGSNIADELLESYKKFTRAKLGVLEKGSKCKSKAGLETNAVMSQILNENLTKSWTHPESVSFASKEFHLQSKESFSECKSKENETSIKKTNPVMPPEVKEVLTNNWVPFESVSDALKETKLHSAAIVPEKSCKISSVEKSVPIYNQSTPATITNTEDKLSFFNSTSQIELSNSPANSLDSQKKRNAFIENNDFNSKTEYLTSELAIKNSSIPIVSPVNTANNEESTNKRAISETDEITFPSPFLSNDELVQNLKTKLSVVEDNTGADQAMTSALCYVVTENVNSFRNETSVSLQSKEISPEAAYSDIVNCNNTDYMLNNWGKDQTKELNNKDTFLRNVNGFSTTENVEISKCQSELHSMKSGVLHPQSFTASRDLRVLSSHKESHFNVKNAELLEKQKKEKQAEDSPLWLASKSCHELPSHQKSKVLNLCNSFTECNQKGYMKYPDPTEKEPASKDLVQTRRNVPSTSSSQDRMEVTSTTNGCPNSKTANSFVASHFTERMGERERKCSEDNFANFQELTRISSYEQRNWFKIYFNETLDAYLQLQGKISTFSNYLESLFSTLYILPKHCVEFKQIIHKLAKMLKSPHPEYLDDFQKRDDLYHKLTRIKHLIRNFDHQMNMS